MCNENNYNNNRFLSLPEDVQSLVWKHIFTDVVHELNREAWCFFRVPIDISGSKHKTPVKTVMYVLCLRRLRPICWSEYLALYIVISEVYLFLSEKLSSWEIKQYHLMPIYGLARCLRIFL